MTLKQRMRLLSLHHDLKSRALPVGSMHSFWDVISDIQAFLKDNPTTLTKTTEEWITYAEDLLEINEGE